MGVFQAKDVITDAVTRALSLFAEHGRGDVVPWPSIEAVSFPRGTTHWPAFNRRFRKRLLTERGITLEAVPGVGLKLLTVHDHLNGWTPKRAAKAGRQLHKAGVEVRAIPDAELTGHQKLKRAFQLDRLRADRNRVRYGGRLMARVSNSGLPRVK